MRFIESEVSYFNFIFETNFIVNGMVYRISGYIFWPHRHPFLYDKSNRVLEMEK